MGDGHHRYEQLAVDHVLGGLSSADSTAFRTHLVACRDCRRRVAELRDIAEGLEEMEREEHLRDDLATITEGAGRREGRLRVVAAITIVALVGVAFWAYHLRRVVDEYATTVASQQAVLEIVAAGEPLATEGADDLRVVAAERDGTVAVMIGDLPTLPADRLILVWLLAGDEILEHRLVAYASVTQETDALPFTLQTEEADRLIVTVERRGAGRPGAPSDQVLARIDLTP